MGGGLHKVMMLISVYWERVFQTSVHHACLSLIFYQRCDSLLALHQLLNGEQFFEGTPLARKDAYQCVEQVLRRNRVRRHFRNHLFQHASNLSHFPFEFRLPICGGA